MPWVNHFGHKTAAQIRDEIGPDEFTKAFKFAFIRNPLDRFVSLFHFLGALPDDHEWFPPNATMIRSLRKYPSFRDFCMNFVRDGIPGWYHFLPQSDYLFIDGVVQANFIGRTEKLDWDLRKLAALLGKKSKRVHLNQSKHDPWPQMYDDESKKIVIDHYAKDFELLKNWWA